MKDIQVWMKNFSQNWLSYDISKVMDGFRNDVEYWESPFLKFDSFQAIQEAWEYIYTQKDIDFQYKIVLDTAEYSVIDWSLAYNNGEEERQYWAGVYVLKLDENNTCYFFKQIGEQGKL